MVQERGGGGVLQPLPWVFAVLQYFGNILLLTDSLSCYLQDEVNITSSKMAANMAAILEFAKNSNLSGKLGNCKYFFARADKYDTIYHFAAFACVL